MDEGSDRFRSRSRYRNNCSSSRSDTRSRDSRRSGRSEEINIADYDGEDGPYVNEGYCVDMPDDTASKTEPAIPLQPGEAKLSSRQYRDSKARNDRLCFLYRQHKADKKAVEVVIKQEKLVQEQFEKNYHENPKSKFKENFQAYIKEHDVWPYATLDAKMGWNKEKPRPETLLICKVERLALAAGIIASMMTTLVRSSMLHKDTRSACARLI